MEAKINEKNRYNRQELIEGWDQQKLTDSTISIIGSDLLAQYIAIPLSALGVGNIRIIDDAHATNDGFLDFTLDGNRAQSIEGKLKLVNPNINIMGLSSRLIGNASKYFLTGSNLVIDATNDPRSKALSLEYSYETKTPLIVTSSKSYYGKLILPDKITRDGRHLLYEFKDDEQDEFVSLVLGGLISEEVKKILMNDNEKLSVPLYYNLKNRRRFTFGEEFELEERKMGEFLNKEVLLIGAGALGNFVGLGLARLGVGRIDIIDPDTIEDTNLNRQILYYDALGEEKAKALSEKIKKIGRKFISSDGFVDRFTEKSAFARRYDAIFDCVDNFTVRSVINDYAIKNKIPLISGGTDYQAGQVAIYVPGKTSCMDCQLNIYELGVKAEERRKKIGCLEAPNPSVIMTNQIIGGIMINEARSVFNSKKYGEPINGNLKYGASLENRLGINFIKRVCKCEPRGGLTIEVNNEEVPVVNMEKRENKGNEILGLL